MPALSSIGNTIRQYRYTERVPGGDVAFGIDLALFLAVLAMMFVGGPVKGLAGFGYAIASTAILATVLDPATAVVILIVPMLVALSVIASIPGLIGVAVGGRFRQRLPDPYLAVGVLVLLTVIALRLLNKGLLGV